MGKTYWVSVLLGAIDDKVRELEKAVKSQIDSVAERQAREWLANAGEGVGELYDEWVDLDAQVETAKKVHDDIKRRRDRVKDRFYDSIEKTPYYSSTAPTEYVKSEVRSSSLDEVMASTPEGAEIERLKSIRKKVTPRIEAARTEKAVMEAVTYLAEKIGIDIGI